MYPVHAPLSLCTNIEKKKMHAPPTERTQREGKMSKKNSIIIFTDTDTSVEAGSDHAYDKVDCYGA